MPKSCLSEDLCAADSESGHPCRKPLFALWILLVPALGCTSLIYGTQDRFSKSICRSFQTDPAAERVNRAEHRAVQLREIETAHANVLYWTRRSREEGLHQAADRAKLAGWQRGYRQRLVLFARMYPCPRRTTKNSP